jgi:DNA helicase IV
MFQEINLLSSEALKQLKKSATVIDSKLANEKPNAHKDSILTAHTKLHLAKQLDKFFTSTKSHWAHDLKTMSV